MTRPFERLAPLGGVGAALSICACFGTTVALAALSAAGIAISISDRALATAILAFAVLGLVGVAAGYRRHRGIGPSLLMAAGVAVLAWAMLVDYSALVEAMAFAALVAATAWDWLRKRKAQRAAGQAASGIGD